MGEEEKWALIDYWSLVWGRYEGGILAGRADRGARSLPFITGSELTINC